MGSQVRRAKQVMPSKLGQASICPPRASEAEIQRILAEAQAKGFGRATLAVRGRGRKTAALAEAITAVFDEFEGSMSTRQVFYQLVSSGAVENHQREYDRTQRLLVDMRRDGEIPFERVVDRTRQKHQRAGWRGVSDLLTAASTQYRRSFWSDQRVAVQVACEKQALEGIFGEVVDEFGASLWTLRGYTSESFAFEWASEISELVAAGKDVRVFFFGDHDPSGLGIEEDARDKLTRHGALFDWERRGLLTEDFERFDLVNVPVKPTDSRARRYLDEHGDRAAELDALRPDELRARIRTAITEHVDPEQWAANQRAEDAERASLHLVSTNWAQALRAVS